MIEIAHPKITEPFKSFSILYIDKPEVNILVIVIEININTET